MSTYLCVSREEYGAMPKLMILRGEPRDIHAYATDLKQPFMLMSITEAQADDITRITLPTHVTVPKIPRMWGVYFDGGHYKWDCVQVFTADDEEEATTIARSAMQGHFITLINITITQNTFAGHTWNAEHSAPDTQYRFREINAVEYEIQVASGHGRKGNT